MCQHRYIYCDNYAGCLWWGNPMCGGTGGIWEFPVLSTQLYNESSTDLEKQDKTKQKQEKSYFLRKKQNKTQVCVNLKWNAWFITYSYLNTVKLDVD